MRRLHGKVLTTTLALCAGFALGACGSTQIPEAPATSPLTSGTVGFSQTGNAQAQIQQDSITYRVDDSGSLVVHLSLTSNASAAQSLAVRASLYDNSGAVIGDATGGQVQVAPGSTVQLQLNGPAPQGTISSAVFEVTATSSPTPTST